MLTGHAQSGLRAQWAVPARPTLSALIAPPPPGWPSTTPMPLKPGIIAEPPLLPPPPHRPKARLSRSSRWLLATVILALGYLSLNEYRPHWRVRDGPLCQRPGRSPVPSGTRNPAYLIKASHGAVASENEICSRMGVDVMKAGGNAVDAAVSTTLCIGVVNMFS